MGIKKAKNMVRNAVDSSIRANPGMFKIVDENCILVGEMTITLTPCINGSVLVTDDRFTTEIIGMEFHSNLSTLIFDVVRRGKMIMSFEDFYCFELGQTDLSGIIVKCVN